MSLSVWKFPLAITDTQTVMMPEGAKLLAAQMQGEQLCLWALVNPNSHRHQARTIEILGTGNQAPDVARSYISTAQQFGGKLVWHIFELTL